MEYTTIFVFILVIFCTTIGFIYMILFFPLQWIFKTYKLKIARLPLSIFIVVLITVFYFVPQRLNNKTATIEKNKGQYILTVTGKRTYMPNTLFQVYIPTTYIETFKITLPKSEGIINGQEIPTDQGGYKLLGSVSIYNKKIRIDLFYDNYSKNIKEPLTWNGDYKLKWKGNE